MKKQGSSFGGVIVGLIFLIAGTILLWWNEGNNVKNIKTVDEIEKNVIDIKSDVIASENEGKLIATNGKLEILDSALIDSTFDVSAKTITLSRIVEVYEYEEEEETSDNNTTYNYKKVWSEDLIDSSNFHNSGYTNPTTLAYNGITYNANNVKLGSFDLSKELIKKVTATEYVTLTKVNLPTGYKISGNYITNADDINNPNIGDIRISWKYNNWESASVIATQSGNTFKSYTSEVGKEVNYIFSGLLTSSEMIQKIVDSNNLVKWIFRFVGAFLIIMGYLAIISPLTKLTSFFPLVGNIAGGLIALLSFLVGLIHSLLIIIVAWLRFRPVISAVLLAVCIILFILLKGVLNKKKNPTVNETAM